MFIKRGLARVIKNSRNENTVEVSLETYHGRFTASAPSGKSKGANEVPDYNDRGILWSIKLANEFFQEIKGKNFMIRNLEDLKQLQTEIKEFEIGFGELGGNVTYAIETAFLKAAAKENKKELWRFIFDSTDSNKVKFPMPVGNCIGGGLHSRGVDGIRPDFQEFLLIPNEKTFAKAVTKNIHAYSYARKLLKKKQNTWTMKRNDEGAWETKLTNEEVLEVLKEISKKFNVRLGLDVASSTFMNKEGYYQYKNKELLRDRTEQIDYMKILITKNNLFYVEDPLNEEDFSGFKELLGKIPRTKSLIVGDDLTTTNLKRVHRAIRSEAMNAMIIKPNQIGSLIEVKEVVAFCKKNNIKMIFSHRSGETMDDALADYAVGFGADFIKTGIHGPERLIKLRRIMHIEKELANKSRFPAEKKVSKK